MDERVISATIVDFPGGNFPMHGAQIVTTPDICSNFWKKSPSNQELNHELSSLFQ